MVQQIDVEIGTNFLGERKLMISTYVHTHLRPKCIYRPKPPQIDVRYSLPRGGRGATATDRAREKREGEDPAALAEPYMDHDTEALDSSAREAPSREGADTSTAIAVMGAGGHDIVRDMPQSAPSATVVIEKPSQIAAPALIPESGDSGATAAAAGGGGEGQAKAGVANLIFPPTCRPSSADDPTQSEATTGSCSPAAAAAGFSSNPAYTLPAEGGGSASSAPVEALGMFPRTIAPPENVTGSSNPSISSPGDMLLPRDAPAPTAVPPDFPATAVDASARRDETAATGDVAAEPPTSDSRQQEPSLSRHESDRVFEETSCSSSGAAAGVGGGDASRQGSGSAAASTPAADTPCATENKPANAPVPLPSASSPHLSLLQPGPPPTDPDPDDPGAPGPGGPARAPAAGKQGNQRQDNDAVEISCGGSSSSTKGGGNHGTPVRTSSLSPSSPLPPNMNISTTQLPGTLQHGSPGGGPQGWAGQGGDVRFVSSGSPHQIQDQFQGHAQQQQPLQAFGNQNGFQQPTQAIFGHPPMQHRPGPPLPHGMVLGGGVGGGGRGELSYQQYSGFSLPVAGRAPLLPAPQQGGGRFDPMLYQQQQQQQQFHPPQQLAHPQQHIDGSMGGMQHFSTPAAPPGATPLPAPATPTPSVNPAHAPSSTSGAATTTTTTIPSNFAAGAPQTPAEGAAVAAAPQGGGSSASGAGGGARGGAALGTVAGVMAAAAAAGGGSGADGEAVQNAYNDIGLVVTRTKELEKIMRDLFHATGEREGGYAVCRRGQGGL